MTITQTVVNALIGNYVVKRQRIDLVEESEVFLYLPTFLSVSVSFPSNWSDLIFSNALDYASKHPLNRGIFVLNIDSNSLIKFNSSHLNTSLKTYDFGRCCIGRGSSLSNFSVFRTQQLYYRTSELFEGFSFYLDPAIDAFASNSIYLHFNRPVTASLSIRLLLSYSP